MSSNRHDADRREELVIERRLTEALASHPAADDPNELRELIREDLAKMKGRK